MSSSESDDELAYDPWSTLSIDEQKKEYNAIRERQRSDFKKIRVQSTEEMQADLEKYGIKRPQKKVKGYDGTALENLNKAGDRILKDVDNMKSADEMGSYFFEYGNEIDDWSEFLDRKFFRRTVKSMFKLRDGDVTAVVAMMTNVQNFVRQKFYELINAGLHPYFPIKVCGSFCTPALLIPYEVMNNQLFKEQVYAFLTDKRLFARHIVPYMQRSGTIGTSVWTVEIDTLGKDVNWKTRAPVRFRLALTDFLSGMRFTVPQREGASDREYFSGTIVEKDHNVVAVELDKSSIERLTKPEDLRFMSYTDRVMLLEKPLEERRSICKTSGYIDLSCQLKQTDKTATGFNEDFLDIGRKQLTPEWEPKTTEIEFNRNRQMINLFKDFITPYAEKGIGEDNGMYHTFCIYDEVKSEKSGTTVVAEKRIDTVPGSYGYSAICPMRSAASMSYSFRRGDEIITKRVMDGLAAEETVLYEYANYGQQQPADFTVETPKRLSFDPLFNICILRAFLIAIFIVAADNNVGGSLG